ncbi:ribosomal protein P2 [Aspergillus puulaauensis]|uniref:60S acidic ribosomal protein P2 n=1 Tax=Aspergillus puulaauensis TaxID=1220207 RepID=A0A7R7X9J3_9EURO|nr:60S acidic ribosomal protein P2 [Aspergillus puulaauensis]BCS17341.1 60S acidic ribosomal protein P2 [Aspergillus puulaauensis]
MKHLAAYLLLTLGGNSEPSAEDIKEVLASVGIDADQGRLGQLLNELRGRDINELIAEGTSKLATGIGSNTGGGGDRGQEAGNGAGDDGSGSANGGTDGDGDGDDDEDDDFGLGLFG